MHNTFSYMPILPARGGAFTALKWLSPLAESRLTPLFDIPDPILKEGATLETHFAARAKGISDAWPNARPVYVDMHNLPPQLRMASGAHPLAYVFDHLDMYGTKAIPVTGTTLDRDVGYIGAAQLIVNNTRRGVCLRLAREDMENRTTLGREIFATLNFMKLSPTDCDLLLDFRYMAAMEFNQIRAFAFEALQIASSLGKFRNMIIAGGSVPEQLGKKDNGKVRREPRSEFDLWTSLLSVFTLAHADYGVVSPMYVPPNNVVNVPSRIRYSTRKDHVFRRARRKDYSALCKELIASPDFSGEGFSLGDLRIYRCAKETIKPGGPAQWVAADANHHLELVSDQVWRYLESSGRSAQFNPPEPVLRPWLQRELLVE
jgi:hypothetical protein